MKSREAAPNAVLVLTTTADDASARSLSRTLVEERLAACVTRTAVRSVYRWEVGGEAAVGEPGRGADVGDSGGAAASMPVCEDDEVLLVIKTSVARVEEVERRILELHAYECPEVVRVVPEHVEPRYLAWLLSTCA